MKKLVSRVVLALSLVAAPAAVVARSCPAQACGPYAYSPEMQVRRVAFAEALRTVGEGGTATLHSVKMDGAAARVVVRFQHAGGARATAQALYLREDAEGEWHVRGRSYVVDARNVGALEG